MNSQLTMSLSVYMQLMPTIPGHVCCCSLLLQWKRNTFRPTNQSLWSQVRHYHKASVSAKCILANTLYTFNFNLLLSQKLGSHYTCRLSLTILNLLLLAMSAFPLLYLSFPISPFPSSSLLLLPPPLPSSSSPSSSLLLTLYLALRGLCSSSDYSWTTERRH